MDCPLLVYPAVRDCFGWFMDVLLVTPPPGHLFIWRYPHSKVEVVSLPVAELVTKLTQSLQRFVNNCCVTPREGDSWEHHTKPKLILVTSEKISLQVLDNIVGEWTCIEF